MYIIHKNATYIKDPLRYIIYIIIIIDNDDDFIPSQIILQLQNVKC